jgi:hypothetical protein
VPGSATSDWDGASARTVLALTLVESASSWSRFLCANRNEPFGSGRKRVYSPDAAAPPPEAKGARTWRVGKCGVGAACSCRSPVQPPISASPLPPTPAITAGVGPLDLKIFEGRSGAVKKWALVCGSGLLYACGRLATSDYRPWAIGARFRPT